MLKPVWVLCVLALSATPALSLDLAMDSGQERNALIELYTAEGCNSCPPAEAHLNALVSDPGLWEHYVPLAFHVGHWDYLGWKDRFALRESDARQRDYARTRRVSTIYTPVLVVNGEPRSPGLEGRDMEISRDRVGNLRVIVAGDHLEALFAPADGTARAEVLNVARVGMGISSRIRAGENRGRESRHEFVVLDYLRVHGRDNRWRARLPEPEAAPAAVARQALVAWVSRVDDPAPVQSVGAYLPR